MNKNLTIYPHQSIISQSTTNKINKSSYKIKLFTIIQIETKQRQLGDKESCKKIIVKCPYCNNNYNNFTRYEVHLRTHTGERPYECNYCKKKFNEKGNLHAHIRIHTGERPFKCTFKQCSMAFKTKGQLKEHFHRHSNSRPFICHICNSTFNRKPHLKVHMKTHKEIAIPKSISSISDSTSNNSTVKDEDNQKHFLFQNMNNDYIKDSSFNYNIYSIDNSSSFLFNEYEDNNDLTLNKIFNQIELNCDQFKTSDDNIYI